MTASERLAKIRASKPAYEYPEGMTPVYQLEPGKRAVALAPVRMKLWSGPPPNEDRLGANFKVGSK